MPIRENSGQQLFVKLYKTKEKKNTMLSNALGEKSMQNPIEDEFNIPEKINININSYVSMATGNLCTTYSKLFALQDSKYILCVDFLLDR
jgi:hypothetical protein